MRSAVLLLIAVNFNIPCALSLVARDGASRLVTRTVLLGNVSV